MSSQVAGERASRSEPRRKHRALRAGAPPAFMSGAVNQGLERRSGTDIEGPHALRSIELVTGHREQVDSQLVDAGRYLADRLRGIRMEKNAVVARDPGARLDRLNRADLVIRVHDADEHRVGADGATHVVGVDESGAVDRKIRDAGALPLEEAARREDRRMLNTRRDDVRGPSRRAKTRLLARNCSPRFRRW